MVLVVLLAEVQLHAGTFEDTLRLAGCLVDDRWDASVRCRGNVVSKRLYSDRIYRYLVCRTYG